MTIQAQIIDKTKLENVNVDLTGKAGYLSDVINNKMLIHVTSESLL